MNFTAPKNNIAQFGLREGMHVADLGAGSGHYSLAAAHMVGTTGRVYAIEVQKDLLQRIKNLALQEKIRNIEIIWGNVEELHGTKLRDNSVDAAILSNILFQFEDKTGGLREAKRILRPAGRMLVVDWAESFGGMGPPQDAVVSQKKARELCEEVGFTFEGVIEAGEHHYGFIVKKT